MEKVLSWVTDISLLVFGVLMVILATVSLTNYNFDEKLVYEYALNWSKGPLLDIMVSPTNDCNAGYEPLISNAFPGNYEGCNCMNAVNEGFQGKVFPYKCTETNIVYGCRMIFQTPPLPLKVWKNKVICVKRMKSSFIDLENKSSNICTIGMKKCGILDTTGNLLCLEPDQDCPINKVEVRAKNDPPSYKYKKLELNSQLDLYFTNTLVNDKVIVEFVASLGPICVYPYEGLLGQNNYILNTLKGKDECSTPINGILADPRFTILDTQNVINFYEENQINDLLSKNPDYPLPKNTISVKIFEINYFGWKQKCHNNKGFTPENLAHPIKLVDSNNKNAYALAIICTVHFILVIGSILIYKMIVTGFNTSYFIMLAFDSVNFAFVFTIFIYSAVLVSLTVRLLEPFNHFMSLNCGDEITNSVLQYGFKGIGYVNKTLIPLCFFATIEVIYLIFYFAYIIIIRNSPGYIELGQRDRND